MNDYELGLFPSPEGGHIPHYYGDYIRIIFLIAAAISAFALPVWGDVLPIGTLPQVVGIVMLVMLAGLTSPHSPFILWVDAIIAALGVVLIENTAITLYSIDYLGVFFAREVLVLLLLVATYFSIKTVRAITTHRLGHHVDLSEFNEPDEEDDTDEEDEEDEQQQEILT